MTKNVEYKINEMVKVQKETGNEYLDMHDVIWDYEVADFIEGFKKMGQKAFTISVGQASLIEILALFQEQGCKVEGVVDYRDKYRMFDYVYEDDEPKKIPHYEKALLLKIA